MSTTTLPTGAAQPTDTARERNPLAIVVVTRKNLWLAGYCELLFPGAGLIYAQRYATGVLISLATLIGVPWAAVTFFQLVSTAITSFSLMRGFDFSDATAFLGQAVTAFLLWTGARVVLAIVLASSHNKTVATTAPLAAVRI